MPSLVATGLNASHTILPALATASDVVAALNNVTTALDASGAPALFRAFDQWTPTVDTVSAWVGLGINAVKLAVATKQLIVSMRIQNAVEAQGRLGFTPAPALAV